MLKRKGLLACLLAISVTVWVYFIWCRQRFMHKLVTVQRTVIVFCFLRFVFVFCVCILCIKMKHK